MANLNLLIPGTGGITLMDNMGKDLGYPVKMRLGVLGQELANLPGPNLVELLSMVHNPDQIAPAKTSLKPGTAISPGHALETAYNQVPGNFKHFLYDWRSDIRYSAQHLLEFLQQEKPANRRWNIVTHSQGGLLVVVASKMLPNATDFADLVASVTFIAAPLAGTVNAARALIDGDQMGASEVPEFQQILRTWPSLYQMLPAWDVLQDANGAPLPASQQLNQLAGWGGLPNISSDLIDRCQTVQAILRDPLANMDGDIQVTFLNGMNRDTGVAIARDANGTPGKTAATAKGDTLVAYDQTYNYVGPTIRQYVEGFDSPCREHSFLLCDPAVMTRVKQLLRS